MNKDATALRHAEHRGLSRLNLSKENVKALQDAADRVWYGGARTKLTKNRYHSKITDDHGHLRGYAAFKPVGNGGRNRLILATILSHEQRPYGSEDISHFFDTKLKDKIEKHPNTPETYTSMHPLPNNTKKTD